MPSTGSPNWKRPGSAGGASLSYTDHGAPESTMPTGEQLLTSSSEAVQGSTTEKTLCSRMRRAMSCVYCAPKSRMTMDSLSLDWGSTDESLKSAVPCKEPDRREFQAMSVRPGSECRSGSFPRGRWWSELVLAKEEPRSA